MSVRTRFAPSPTGYLHVGGARTALFNWLYARKHGGGFVLRVEDTDEARNTEDAKQAIFDGLEWLGLDWDEGPRKGGESGPYFQSERKSIHDAWFQKLADTGRVYQDDGAWRFRFERKPVTMRDLVCGEVTIDYRDESNTPDMVVKRSDGSYVFHFVNVVDDLDMGITHVIRGEDHLMNTPKHLQLIEALGGVAPEYAHIPLILNPDGSKMSKRDAGAALGDYPRQGYLPEAVANFLALLGWNPKTDEEIFSMAGLVDRFSLQNVNRAPARFDMEKCRWMNQQHLMLLPLERFHILSAGFVGHEGYGQEIAAVIQEKVRLLSEVPRAVDFLLTEELSDIEDEALGKVRGRPELAPVLDEIAHSLEGIDDWSADAAKNVVAAVASAHGMKPGPLMFPLRVALSGRGQGPDIADILTLLGKDRCVNRVRKLASEI